MEGIEIDEIKEKGFGFNVWLAGDAYTELAKIRNARYGSDIEALASVIERGLIELNADIASSKE